MIRYFSIVVLLFAFNSHSFAKDISVKIDGKTYVCSGNGGTGESYCTGKIDGLKLLVSSCKESYGASYCIDKYWSDFVSDNPECKAEGLPLCINNCKESYGGAYCADKCNRA